jgi:hypothetical protein
MNAFKRYPRRFALAVALSVLALATGCSRADKPATIHGTITYKGEPVTSGMLRFVGENGAFATAPIQPDGTFTITDVRPGAVKVGLMMGPQSAGASDAKPGVKAPAKKVAAKVPAKYSEPATSGLNYNITGDTKELAIELQ